MKNYFKKLKKELPLFLIAGFLFGIITGYVYLLNNPVVYRALANLVFSDAGVDVVRELGLIDSPHKIFQNENLKFLSKAQKQGIELNISPDYKSILIEVKGNDPESIYRIANNVAESYLAQMSEKSAAIIEKRQNKQLEKINKLFAEYKQQLTQTSESLANLEPQLDSLKRQYDSNEALRASLQQRMDAVEIRKSSLLRKYTESHPEVVGLNIELDSLKEKARSLPVIQGIGVLEREASKERAKYNDLQGKVTSLEKEKDSLMRMGKDPLVTVEARAIKPRKPAGDLDTADIYKRFIFFGIGIGLLISLLTTAFKDTIVSECDFGIANVKNLPLLTSIPFVKQKRSRKLSAAGKNAGAHLLFSYDDSSEYVNTYRSLVTHIKLEVFKDNIDKKVMLFTSPTSKTGKSTVAANVSIVLARLGKKVVLLDANLNRTSVAKFFGIRARVLGISDILSGKADLESSLKGVTDMLLGGINWDAAMKAYGLDRLKVLPSGKRVSDPSGLLETKAVAELFAELREKFDCIIVDTPSLLKNPDPIILSANADAIFVVCKTGLSSQRDLLNCSKKLKEVKINYKGSILICI